MAYRDIIYNSKQLLEFYSHNRCKWSQLYPSEQWVFEKVSGKDKNLGKVLDVGCACGGLASALSGRFSIASYTGVDINKETIEWAKRNISLKMPTIFIADDIISQQRLGYYDTVVSLSCADWNIETDKIIGECWRRVKAKGYFIISLRLTQKKGVNDIRRSYQYINFSGSDKTTDIANYVVFNARVALNYFSRLRPKPELIGAYGYWGRPSVTASTCFKRLVFAVFYIRKGMKGANKHIMTELNLPLDVFMDNSKRKRGNGQ